MSCISNHPCVDTQKYEPVSVYYGPFERVLRTSVFQYGVAGRGWIEKMLIYLYKAIVGYSPCPSLPKQTKFDASLSVMKAFGAEDRFVVTEDGHSKVHMLRLTAIDFERILESKGASWRRDGTLIAIFLPKVIDDDWKKFEKNVLLNKTGWKKREGDGAIITCRYADKVRTNAFCFFHFHSPGMSMTQDRRRLGFYLGMKQDVCFFDHGGTGKSKGNPSEKRYYLEAEAIWNVLKQAYPTNRVILSGTCGGTMIAAHMKKVLHSEGVHFIAEQSFVDLRESMIETQGIVPRSFGNWTFSAIFCRDIPKDKGPQEDGFSLKKKWESLPMSHYGKVIIVHSPDDQTLPKGEEERLFALSRRVNKSVVKVSFRLPGKNAHNELCLKDGHMHSSYVSAIFS